MTQDRVRCDICKEEFRATPSHINLICKGCFKKERQPDATGKELIEAFLSKEQSIPLIAKIIEKETIEEYCSSEIIAELIYNKLKEKWERRK